MTRRDTRGDVPDLLVDPEPISVFLLLASVVSAGTGVVGLVRSISNEEELNDPRVRRELREAQAQALADMRAASVLIEVELDLLVKLMEEAGFDLDDVLRPGRTAFVKQQDFRLYRKGHRRLLKHAQDFHSASHRFEEAAAHFAKVMPQTPERLSRDDRLFDITGRLKHVLGSLAEENLTCGAAIDSLGGALTMFRTELETYAAQELDVPYTEPGRVPPQSRPVPAPRSGVPPSR